ncbi:nitrate reductase molybdenum cofactor assembly chaperone [Hyphobacterium sp. HN65]|uniref:Nitrate reductase molybdenum cofactor assembly chaperone n=1 Tax=Hyphobacterium lacteum TaxID=3116575 RepID=A0ABU7LP72_9PROT|nr:nitrate reductase molybdenum cofactor assembly chaperone [Hyphobacterium sp. HN65]MEE2525709.1 nitrate reductase molybdenum cofactor assembly chaperone [Hyphobacterium sp. HN65]
MTRTFKVLAALLNYPTQEIAAAAPEFGPALAEEALIPDRQIRVLEKLADQLAERDLYDLQERYVQLFDRSRSLSLHLFEHVHGESRDRGQAMVDLKALYEAHGLEPAANELPDFLPLFLEFLSTQALDEARALLGEAVHVTDALADRLSKRDSIYASVFRALGSLADRNAALDASVETPASEDQSLEALDKAWEEEQVVFGPDPNAGCPVAKDMLADMAPPPPQHSGNGEPG